jgi:hypothetical protein
MAIRIRDGSRSFLNAAELCCKFSRMRGFSIGLERILGEANASSLIGAFEPFCAVVDGLISADDWFNQKDHTDETSNAEDEGLE